MKGELTKDRIIKPKGVYPIESHERKTVEFLSVYFGYDIEYIPPVNKKGTRTPDIKMNGLEWEIKCPTGHGKYTIQHAIRKAVQQSKNIIMDFRNNKVSTNELLRKLKKEIRTLKDINNLLIITKELKVRH